MKKTFIRTKNVKQFVSLMDELQKLPSNIPKLALVYGDHGLGKSQTILWWATRNDAVYGRAAHKMTTCWLLRDIAEGRYFQIKRCNFHYSLICKAQQIAVDLILQLCCPKNLYLIQRKLLERLIKLNHFYTNQKHL